VRGNSIRFILNYVNYDAASSGNLHLYSHSRAGFVTFNEAVELSVS
jgi:hypothetical protein